MMAQPGLGSQCLPRGAPGGSRNGGRAARGKRAPPGKVQLRQGAVGRNHLVQPAAWQEPRVQWDRERTLVLRACVSRSAHPAHSTAGPGASPGGCGGLPSLPSGSAVDLGAGPNTPAVSELLQRQGKAPIPIPCRQVWWRREVESGRDTSVWGHRELWELLQWPLILAWPWPLLSLLLSLRTYCPLLLESVSTCVPAIPIPHGAPSELLSPLQSPQRLPVFSLRGVFHLSLFPALPCPATPGTPAAAALSASPSRKHPCSPLQTLFPWPASFSPYALLLRSQRLCPSHPGLSRCASYMAQVPHLTPCFIVFRAQTPS